MFYISNQYITKKKKNNKIKMSSYLTPSPPLHSYTKLWLLICKNKSLQFANPINTLIIIVTPIVCFLLTQMFSLTHSYGPVDAPETRFPPLVLNVPNVTSIFYSPINHVVAEIVKDVASYFNQPKIESYLYASELEVALKVNDAFVGIEFEDHFRNILEIPPKVKVALRFPLHARTRENKKWTKQLFKQWNVREDLYATEGFLYIQQILFEAIIRSENRSALIPQVYMQGFPEAARTTYRSVVIGHLELMYTFFLIFMCPSLVICLMIVSEKQRNLRDMMQIMGLSNGLNWLSWFIVTFCLLLIPSIIIVIMLKAFLCYNSSYVVLMFIFVIHILGMISLIFVISALFSNSFLAMIVLCITNMVSTIPFMVTFLSQVGYVNAFVLCLFLNSGMPFVFFQMFSYELYGVGVQWDNMFRRAHPDDPMCYGTMLTIMIFTTLFYTCLFIYLDKLRPEGLRTPKKWYFPFTRQFYCPSRPAVSNTLDEEEQELDQEATNRSSSVFETVKTDNLAMIDCYKLTKYFREKAVLKDFTLKLYLNEITVLFGHNGAGKTSLFLMLTGLYPPTSGRVLINGQDMAVAPTLARRHIGLCPENNIFFEDLSAFWHIFFFCRLKGLSRAMARAEAYSYLYKINLRNTAHMKVKKLSTAMRRKLSLCCALCGDSKVVLCDEPSAYLDPNDSRQIWDLLRSEKDGRCIVINTYDVNAADVLGDRIGIISDGQLVAYGTPDFLMKNLGPGYRLVCVRQEDCVVGEVTKFLQRKMHEIRFEDVTNKDILYRLPMEKLYKFPKLFRALESRLEKLRLASFSVSSPTMDETFLKIGLNRIDPNEIVDPNALGAWMEDILETSKRRRCAQEWHGMFIKKMLFTRYSLIPFLCVGILPLLVTVVILFFDILEKDRNPYDIPPFSDLSMYPGAHVVWEGETNDTTMHRPAILEDNSEVIASEYDKIAMFAGATVINIKSNMEEYLIENIRLLDEGFSKTYVTGATFRKGSITVWYNRRLEHGKPISLNLIYKAIGHALARAEIEVINKPRNSSKVLADLDIMQNASTHTTYVMIYLSIAMAIFIMLPIQERVSHMMQMQLFSGVHCYTYWLSHFIWDYMIFLIFTLSVLMSYYQKSAVTLHLLLIFFLAFAFASLPFIYICSFAFKDSNIGMSVMILVHLIIVMVAACLISYREHLVLQYLHYPLLIIPHYSMFMATVVIFMYGNTMDVCQTMDLSETNKYCTSAATSMVAKTEFIFLLVSGIIFQIILMLITKYPPVECANKYNRERCQVTTEDRDVKEMRSQIDRLVTEKDQLKECSLVCDRITKRIRDQMPVNCVSFMINPYECFGLLGLSGSGKTMVIESIMGSRKVTQGDIYIKGFNTMTERRKCRNYIGYCPQLNAVLHFMTGREMLNFACHVRGVKKAAIPDLIVNLAKCFSITKNLDQISVTYTNGTKRKLNIAMAVLSPCLICLDEPITGLDLCARHQISMMLSLVRSNGKALLITSNSVADCEELCTCLAVIVNGRLRCIGSAEHLKTRFNRGLSVTIQVCTRDEMDEIRTRRSSRQSSKSENTKSQDDKSSDMRSLASRNSEIPSPDDKSPESIDHGQNTDGSTNALKTDLPNDKAIQVKMKRKKELSIETEVPSTSQRVSSYSGKDDAEREQSIGRGKLVSKRRKTSSRITHGKAQRIGSTQFNTLISTNHDNNFYSLILEVENKFKFDFPDSYVTEMYSSRGLVTIAIPDKHLQWSEIYKYMEDNRYYLQIKKYSISKTTLEDIFLHFVQRKD